MSFPRMRIGTRGSPLALAQTHQVRAALSHAHGVSEEAISVCVIRTTGDAIRDRPLAEAGGKGLFTRELDLALLNDEIDVAVHSAKDIPTLIPDDLLIPGFLERDDVRDCFISLAATRLEDLPRAARVGTASLRRAAQVRHMRRDLLTPLLRGNVETRLRKVETSEVDATLLALAGLKRLGLEKKATAILSTRDFLPAPGQGAIGLMTRADDQSTQECIAPILHEETSLAVAAERTFLSVLDGSCRTSIAALAEIANKQVSLRGIVLRPDGSEVFDVQRSGPAADAIAIGEAAGRELLTRLPAGVLAA
ncbi:MAG: hydroxymethylbilane synthase [Methylobacteriaceae bacterium]|nr:hydroxymethylbilane synthase [Methylobacteriaceae bacterium]MBV9396213.1 hydroxymethylbilane synthase [Methylobacteriaceae bacterium]